MISEMVHSILKFLGGIQQYGVWSLCLFASVFAGVFISVLFQKRSHLDYMSRIALDNETEPTQTRERSHE
jgi:hypothetical protein